MEMKSKVTVHTDDPLTHAAGLSAVWQKCMSELYKSERRGLTPKEHGQLGKLKKSLGMTKAAQVVDYAIRDWDKLVRKIAQLLGSDIFPPKPCVGWLYQYHAIAVLMLHDELQAIAEQKAKKDSIVKQAAEEAKRIAAKNAADEGQRKQKRMTVQEVQAIEAEVDAEFAAKHPEFALK